MTKAQSKNPIDELETSLKDSTKANDDLILMLKDPKKFFEKYPIVEDWPNPPSAPSKEEIKQALSIKADTKTKIKMYATLSALTHYQKRASKLDPNFKYASDYKHKRKLEEQIATRLRQAGYSVQTQSNVSEWNNLKDPVLHFGIAEGLMISEIPKCQGNNHNITEYITNQDGTIKDYQTLIADYQKDHAIKTDYEEITQDLTDTQKQMLKEFCEEEKINQDEIIKVHNDYDSDILEVETANREYQIMESEEEAETKAFDMIDNDDEMKYFFTEAVKQDDFTGSLEDFKQAVKDDGWYYQLCRYDDEFGTTKSGFVYWRSN